MGSEKSMVDLLLAMLVDRFLVRRLFDLEGLGSESGATSEVATSGGDMFSEDGVPVDVGARVLDEGLLYSPKTLVSEPEGFLPL